MWNWQRRRTNSGLSLDFSQSQYRGLVSATDAILLPEPKTQAMRGYFVVLPIRSREVR
jgi:hypothetical protein